MEIVRILVELARRRGSNHLSPINYQMLGLSWARYRKACGLDAGLTLHSLRHRAITLLVRNAPSGEVLKIIQKMVGHAEITQTMSYVTEDPSLLAGSMEASSRALEEARLARQPQEAKANG